MLDICILNFFVKILYLSNTIKLLIGWKPLTVIVYKVSDNAKLLLQEQDNTPLRGDISYFYSCLHVSVVGAIDATTLR